MLSGTAGQAAQAAFWLAVVLLLIVGVARGLRRLPALRAAAKPGSGMVLASSLALDARRRIHLIEAGDHRALVLTGGSGDVVVMLPADGAKLQ